MIGRDAKGQWGAGARELMQSFCVARPHCPSTCVLSRAHLPRLPLLTSQGPIASLQYVLAGSSVEALHRMALVGVHEYKVLSFNTVQEIGGCWAVGRLPAAFAQALVGRVGHAWAPAPAQHILGAPLGTRHGTNTSHSPPHSTLIGAEAPSADDLAAAAATAAANSYKPRSPSILTMHHLSCVTTTLEDAVEYDRCPLAEGVLADLERRYPNEPAPLRLWRVLCDPGARFKGWCRMMHTVSGAQLLWGPEV